MRREGGARQAWVSYLTTNNHHTYNIYTGICKPWPFDSFFFFPFLFARSLRRLFLVVFVFGLFWSSCRVVVLLLVACCLLVITLQL